VFAVAAASREVSKIAQLALISDTSRGAAAFKIIVVHIVSGEEHETRSAFISAFCIPRAVRALLLHVNNNVAVRQINIQIKLTRGGRWSRAHPETELAMLLLLICFTKETCSVDLELNTSCFFAI